MADREIESIGTVPTRWWAGFTQLAIQLLAWPFFFIGGIGVARTLIPYMVDSPEEVTDETVRSLLLGLALGGGLLGVGALLRYGASWFRGAVFLPGDWYTYMENSVRRDRHEAAAEAANALIALVPRQPTDLKMQAKAHVYLGFFRDSESHWRAAIPLLDRVLADEPRNLEVRLDRAQAFQNTSRHEEALADIEHVISAVPSPVLRALSMRISNLTSLKQFKEALRYCDELDRLANDFEPADEIRQAANAHREEIEEKLSSPTPTEATGAVSPAESAKVTSDSILASGVSRALDSQHEDRDESYEVRHCKGCGVQLFGSQTRDGYCASCRIRQR